ncbi:glycosyltransferase [candidate division KSB1 bacterium]
MPVEMNIILFFIFTVYFLISIIVFFATLKKDSKGVLKSLPFISILISARNEEKNILGCLESLKDQSYPPGQFEVIIINDHSADNTESVVKEFIDRTKNFHLLNAPEGVHGKRKALVYGIEKAKGEFLFQIDADCTAGRDWLSELVSSLSEGNSITGGFTLIDKPESVIERIQALDWVYIQSVGTAISRIKKPFSIFGNNMAFKKNDYLDSGGYDKINREILIDYQLVQLMLKNKSNKGKLIFNKGSIVNTKPVKNFFEYLKQRKRWGRGTFNINVGGKLILLTSLISSLMLLVSPFFVKQFIWFFVLKISGDLLILYNPLRFYKRLNLLFYFIFYEIFHILNTVVLGIVLPFSKKVEWKGRELK